MSTDIRETLRIAISHVGSLGHGSRYLLDIRYSCSLRRLVTNNFYTRSPLRYLEESYAERSYVVVNFHLYSNHPRTRHDSLELKS